MLPIPRQTVQVPHLIATPIPESITADDFALSSQYGLRFVLPAELAWAIGLSSGRVGCVIPDVSTQEDVDALTYASRALDALAAACRRQAAKAVGSSHTLRVPPG